jgi:sec-independent protein translocase protein TatA
MEEDTTPAPGVCGTQIDNMNIMLGLFNLGGGEIILILAIILILFGAKRLPELAKGLGQGIKEFKKATHNASEGLRESMPENPASTLRRLAPATTSSTALESGFSCVAPAATPEPRDGTDVSQ